MWAIKSGPSQVKTDRRGGKSLKQTQEEENHFYLWQRVRLEDYWRGIWLHIPCQVSDISLVRRVETFHYVQESWASDQPPIYLTMQALINWQGETVSAGQSWLSISQGNVFKQFWVVNECCASEGSILYWSWDLNLNPCRVSCDAARQRQRSGQQSGCGVKYASQRVHLVIITLAVEIIWHISLLESLPTFPLLSLAEVSPPLLCRHFKCLILQQ